MTDSQLVSVVVPAWNSESTLLQTLQSVASQTYENIEILVVDDGSTDRTAEVAERFCEIEPRARLIRKDNGGLSSARNRGIAEAKGDWIAPIDADDLWHPTKTEKQMRLAGESNQQLGFVYCWYRQIDEEGRLLSSGPRLSLRGRVFNQLAYRNAVENGSALLLSRKAVLAVGGYDERLSALEDVMLQLRIAKQFPIDLIEEHLVGWRRHSSNMSGDPDLVARWTRVVYDRLTAEGVLLTSGPRRWVAGRDFFNTAEQKAGRGMAAAAIGSLLRAIRHDPVRNGLLLLYRSLRSVRRRLGGDGTEESRMPLLNAVDPGAEIAGDPHALPKFWDAIERLDRRRLGRLAELDAAAAPKAS